MFIFFFSSRRRHTRLQGDWSSDVCSSDLLVVLQRDGNRQAAALDHAASLLHGPPSAVQHVHPRAPDEARHEHVRDRKSTRLNSSHLVISYAVFCLKKKKQNRYKSYWSSPC